MKPRGSAIAWLVTLVAGPRCGETLSINGRRDRPPNEIRIPVDVVVGSYVGTDGVERSIFRVHVYRLERTGEAKTAVFRFSGSEG